MKQEITSEKIKKLELKRSMLNFKIFSLMKKQLFSLVMLLALLIGAGASANAQNGSGLTPSSIYMVAVGATTQFQITNEGTFAADINWEVFDATTAQADNYTATGLTGATAVSQYNFVTGLTNPAILNPDADALAAAAVSNCFVQWISTPANNLFIVQATATTDGGSCVTIRRFYVSVFNFNVSVFLVADATGASPVSTDKTQCNSWDGLVIGNSLTSPAVATFEGTEITDPHANYTNNDGSALLKYTDTYFMIRFNITGTPPANFGLEDFKWRLRFETPDWANMSVWTISNVTAPNSQFASFISSGAATIGDAGAPASEITALTSANTWTNGMNELVFPQIGGAVQAVAQSDYVFRVRTHNNLGQAAMVYDINLLRAELEFDVATNNFNDGYKVNSNTAGTNPEFTAATEITGNQTINQTPATTVIDILH